MRIVESDFEYNGYRCITIFTSMGYRCGYVGLPEGHPLYGMVEDSELDITLKELCTDEEMGKLGKRSIFTLWGLPDDEDDNVKLYAYFNVHGGITYASGGKESHHPIDSDLWWLGFDCGHAGDGCDYALMKELWSDDMVVQMRLENPLILDGDEIRTVEYVKQECRNLVDQIINLIHRGKKDD